MSDLISREWVLKEIRALRAYAQSFCQVTYATGYMCGLSGLEGRLADAPVVDAVPVVHGQWELHGNDDDCGSSYSCTNCGSGYDEDCFYDHGQYVPYLFCPNCGAKMDSDR